MPPAPVYEPGCLMNRLAGGRLARVAFLLPPPEKCSTEHLLSVQVPQISRLDPVTVKYGDDHSMGHLLLL